MFRQLPWFVLLPWWAWGASSPDWFPAAAIPETKGVLYPIAGTIRWATGEQAVELGLLGELSHLPLAGDTWACTLSPRLGFVLGNVSVPGATARNYERSWVGSAADLFAGPMHYRLTFEAGRLLGNSVSTTVSQQGTADLGVQIHTQFGAHIRGIYSRLTWSADTPQETGLDLWTYGSWTPGRWGLELLGGPAWNGTTLGTQELSETSLRAEGVSAPWGKLHLGAAVRYTLLSAPEPGAAHLLPSQGAMETSPFAGRPPGSWETMTSLGLTQLLGGLGALWRVHWRDGPPSQFLGVVYQQRV